MKIGDLIMDCDTGDIGLLVSIDHNRLNENSSFKQYCPFLILSNGRMDWLEQMYIEKECKVISESR